MATRTPKTTEPEVEAKQSFKVRTQLDPHTIVPVRNGYQGTLVYVSKRTGEKYVWDQFGDEQDMELGELKTAKSASIDYFKKNLFMIEDNPEVLEALGVSQYYEHALKTDDFDDIFTQAPSTLKKTLDKLSEGQKRAVAYRAKQLIADNKIDSLKVIDTLENCLNVVLIER